MACNTRSAEDSKIHSLTNELTKKITIVGTRGDDENLVRNNMPGGGIVHREW